MLYGNQDKAATCTAPPRQIEHMFMMKDLDVTKRMKFECAWAGAGVSLKHRVDNSVHLASARSDCANAHNSEVGAIDRQPCVQVSFAKRLLNTDRDDKNVHPLQVGFVQSGKGRNTSSAEARPVGASSALVTSLCTSLGEPRIGGASGKRKPQKGRAGDSKRKRKNSVTLTGAAASSLTVLKPWSRLGCEGQYREAMIAAGRGGGLAFSLNLSIGREAGSRASKAPLRNITKRINEATNRHGLKGLPLALNLEFSPEDGRLHLHGVILPGQHDRDAIKKALMDGAGRASPLSRPTQLRLKCISDAEGWFGYCSKTFGNTSEKLGTKRFIYISHPMKAVARAVYQEMRLGHRAANLTLRPLSRSQSVI